MRKKEFLNKLRQHLTGLPEDDVNEIIEDYEEHFIVGKRKKRKESEIAKSLGSPKEIARSAKKELGESKEDISIKTQLREFWIDAKKLSKKVFRSAEKEFPKAKKEVAKAFRSFEKSMKNQKKSKKSKKKSNVWKVVLLTAFNLLVMIWIWFSLFMVVISLFIAGISISISGFAAFIASLFVLMNPVDFMARNMALSGLFAGVGLFFMGILWSIGTSKVMKGLTHITKHYIKLNKRLSRR